VQKVSATSQPLPAKTVSSTIAKLTSANGRKPHPPQDAKKTLSTSIATHTIYLLSKPCKGCLLPPHFLQRLAGELRAKVVC